jgi:5-methyltetrahydropteroyltriglutamate--homocysteine methyltransferase
MDGLLLARCGAGFLIGSLAVICPACWVRIHICWGNYEGPHDHDIPFTKVAPILVKAKPMALVVEAANPRHAHEWTVWQETKLTRS